MKKHGKRYGKALQTHWKALKNIDLESTNRIIEMAWEDRTPFEVIEKEFSINHGELINIMRNNLKETKKN